MSSWSLPTALPLEGHRRWLAAGVLAKNPQCPEDAGVPELGSHHEDPSPRALEDPRSPQVSPRLRSARTVTR